MIYFMKKLILFFVILCSLAGCSAKNPLQDFRFQTVPAAPYVTASWYRLSEPGKDVVIYIEGEGEVQNPTPSDLFLRRAASQDPSPNVAYLARPCQYLKTSACSPVDWQEGRFSKKIVSSMNQAFREALKKSKSQKAVLVGYAGGAQIAGWLALENPDLVREVVTINGILDSDAWAAYHKMSPLTGLNLKHRQEDFATLRQNHYVGGKNEFVPPFLVTDFVQDSTRVHVLEKATHEKGLEPALREIYRKGRE